MDGARWIGSRTAITSLQNTSADTSRAAQILDLVALQGLHRFILRGGHPRPAAGIARGQLQPEPQGFRRKAILLAIDVIATRCDAWSLHAHAPTGRTGLTLQ